jgi:transposase-like protein
MGRKIKYSFKQWCEDNNRHDLLNRWDYEKTGFAPEDITFASAKPVYFKCPKGIHESEKKRVNTITSGPQNNFICKKCNEEFRHDIKDMTGMKFGELTVLSLDQEKTRKQKEAYWLCQCSCGAIKSVRGASLRNGVIKTCANRKIHWTGENASNWRGGVTPININIRNSEEYNRWRENVLKKDGYKCVVCGRDYKLEAHHIYPFSLYEDKRFDIDCGIIMCYDHHSMYADGSFHKEYGTYDNTPEQLEEYINRKRSELGITEPFDISKYMNDLSPTTLPYPEELPPDLDNIINIA